MKILIHGSDLEKSRNDYFSKKNLLKNPAILNGESLTYDYLFQLGENSSLFNEKNQLIIENLFSKSKSGSKELSRIIELINKSATFDLLIWEQNEISKTNLNLLKNFEIYNFPLPQKLFQFVDQIKPNNPRYLIELYHELRRTQEAEMIFFMMVRQFRILLQFTNNQENKIDEIKRLAPWQISKFKQQLSYFNLTSLINSYNKLYEIETLHKTGKNTNSLDISIDFFLSGL